MNNSSIPPTSGNTARCPFLGLDDDPKTALAYPSPWNCCYRAAPHAPVSVPQQMSTCLVHDHTKCNVYLSTTSAELPRELRGMAVSTARKRRSPAGMVGLVSLAALLSLAIVLVGFRLRSTGETVTFSSGDLPVQAINIDPSQPTGLQGITSTLTAANVPSVPTQTGGRTCGHALDIPFGGEVQFVIHKVAKGENLNMYADRFETTTNAISEINFEMRNPIWEDSLVVIPINTTLMINIPPFQIYQTTSNDISTDELAVQLDTDPGSFRKYNGFDDTCELFSGWVLIPRKRSEP